jgi:hypothetical protein
VHRLSQAQLQLDKEQEAARRAFGVEKVLPVLPQAYRS